MSDYADFHGPCGESKDKHNPKVVTSQSHLQRDQEVRLNGNSNLSTCIVGNNNAKVYGISLTESASSVYYRYTIYVDAEGPHGFGSGSLYLAFKDETDDVYYLSIFRSDRMRHSVSFDSDAPAIKEIYWCDFEFTVEKAATSRDLNV
ncbi:hypothetical protein [Nocardia grenadensis]|uniref:hypothetical protein n=1 Tax=Nocardia grenadensis TaxID=931537 RepID=UPI0007A3B8B8|nr:hypothetical protein [Nocardia grenadensis]